MARSSIRLKCEGAPEMMSFTMVGEVGTHPAAQLISKITVQHFEGSACASMAVYSMNREVGTLIVPFEYVPFIVARLFNTRVTDVPKPGETIDARRRW